MRRAWFAIGLAFVLLGMILAANALQTVLENKIESEKIASVTKQSSVSANLQKGDKMVVDIRYGTDWPQDPLDYDQTYPGYAVLLVTLNITDPTGNATTYDIIYGRLKDRFALGLLNITITHHGGLNATGLYREKLNMYEGIGGVTMYNGTYTVTVPQNYIYPPKQSPPAALEISKGKIVEVTKQPYIYYLPSGMVLSAVGVIASALAFRSPRRVIRSKNKKDTHLSHKNAVHAFVSV